MDEEPFARSNQVVQGELHQLHADGLPSFIQKLGSSIENGPSEWLWDSINGCPCGNCGDGAGRGGLEQRRDPCFFVDAALRVNPRQPYGTSATDPLRVRIVLAPSHGSPSHCERGSSWPTIRVLSNITHIAVDSGSGTVNPGFIALGAEHLPPPSREEPLGAFVEDALSPSGAEVSILNTLRILTLLLTGEPPVALFGEAEPAESSPDGNNVHTQWAHLAAHNGTMRSVKEAYRQRGLCAHPALLGTQDPHDSGGEPAGPAEAASALEMVATSPATAAATAAAAATDTTTSSLSTSPYHFWGPSPAFPEGILEPRLVDALVALRGVAGGAGDGGAAVRAHMREEIDSAVFSFPLFTASFCVALMEELEAFEKSGLPARRPNSMNNYGTIVNNIGMEGFMTRFQDDVSRPLGSFLFPGKGYEWLDSHHSFSVRYTAGEDLGLDMHTDDSDVTFNVCLGKPGFTAAGLTFCGVMGKADHRQFQMRYRHEIGRCITHLGQQRHGADDIAEGTRINLIMWNKSLVSRRRKEHDTSNEYERESGAPSEQCLSYTHDRDYTVYKPHPKGHSAKRGWCPPPGKEYQNPSLGIRWKGDQ
jgi:hypothetical protein